VLGAVPALLLRGLPRGICIQVGLFATIGLAAKTGILIVDFAKTLQEQGRDAVDAALTAARMRLRPIVVPSQAFGFDVLPLAFGTGAGGQHAIGTCVIAGASLGVPFVPLFFVLIRRRGGARQRKTPAKPCRPSPPIPDET